MPGTFNVRDPAIETTLRDLAAHISDALEGRPFGFALFLVEFHTADGGLFYISNTQRGDIVGPIAQWCARQRQ
jgi:hypothetical protein